MRKRVHRWWKRNETDKEIDTGIEIIMIMFYVRTRTQAHMVEHQNDKHVVSLVMGSWYLFLYIIHDVSMKSYFCISNLYSVFFFYCYFSQCACGARDFATEYSFSHKPWRVIFHYHKPLLYIQNTVRQSALVSNSMHSIKSTASAAFKSIFSYWDEIRLSYGGRVGDKLSSILFIAITSYEQIHPIYILKLIFIFIIFYFLSEWLNILYYLSELFHNDSWYLVQ